MGTGVCGGGGGGGAVWVGVWALVGGGGRVCVEGGALVRWV